MATADVKEVEPAPASTPAAAKREPEVNKLFRMVMKHEAPTCTSRSASRP